MYSIVRRQLYLTEVGAVTSQLVSPCFYPCPAPHQSIFNTVGEETKVLQGKITRPRLTANSYLKNKPYLLIRSPLSVTFKSLTSIHERYFTSRCRIATCTNMHFTEQYLSVICNALVFPILLLKICWS